jgi:hypothetical protein
MYKESFIALKQDIVSLVPDWTRKSIKVKTTDTKGNKVTERRPLVKMSEFVELIDSKL